MKYSLILLALMWVSKSFFAVDDMVVFLNKMSKERQHEARILVTTNRNAYVYSLIYRK